MTVFNDTPPPHRPLAPPRLTPRQLVLLGIVLDYMLDPARARTLGQALSSNEPLELLRMLAQQWSTGLSTLSGDLDHVHSTQLKPALAARFVEDIKAALLREPQLLNLPGEPQAIYGELVRRMAKNQPHQAAWCAALLWHRPLTLN